MANQQQLAGKWNEIKGQVKKKWGALTDQDLTEAQGNVERLVGVIQRKTGEGRQSIEKYVDQLLAGGESMAHEAVGTAHEYANAAEEYVGEAYQQVAAAVGEGYDKAEHYVQQNPAQSVGIAFGSGVVLGVVVGLMLCR